MPHVVISGQSARRFTGGQTEFEVEANTFRRMVLELDRRFPGLGRQIEESMTVRSTAKSFRTPTWLSSNPRARSADPENRRRLIGASRVDHPKRPG
jgi:hypothetical protein